MRSTTKARHDRSSWRNLISGIAALALIVSAVAIPGASPAMADDLPDATPPVATINSPTADPVVSVEVGAALTAAFECVDPQSPSGELTSGLAAADGCVGEVFAAGAPEGEPALATPATGAALDTSAPGSFELRVTATDAAGLTGTASVTYTVVEPTPPVDATDPVVTITSPVDAAEIEVGTEVLADYSCTDEEGGSGLESCIGDVPDGAALDTNAPGAATFTVTATDGAGNTATQTVGYTVVSPPPPPPAAAELTGRVRDTAGTPLPGSTVEVREAGTTTVVSSTTTNGDGGYSLFVSAGTYDVFAFGPEGSGLGARELNRVLPAGVTTINWALSRPLVTVSGRVLWDGVPSFMASVWVYCPSGSSSASPDTSGNFTLQVVAQTGCTLSLQTMNAGSVTGIPINATTDLALGTLDVPYSTVDVYVRTATTAVVPGAGVTLNNTTTTGMMSNFTSTVTLAGGLTGTASQYSVFGTTNAEGVAHLKVIGTPTGQAKVGTNGGNGTPATTTNFTLTPPHTDVTIDLPTTVTVSGRVLWDGVVSFMASVWAYCPSGSSSASPDTSGNFTLQVVAQTGCTLSLQTMNAGSVTGIPINPTTDLALGTLDVPYSTVDVYVRTATTAVVPGAGVTLNNTTTTGMMSNFTSTVTLAGGLTGTASQYSVFGTTNAEGVAHLKVIGTPTGQAKAGTNGGNGTPATTTNFTLTPPHTDVTIDLPTTVTVSGRVLWDGVPSFMASVWVYCPSGSSSASPDTSGNFSLQVVAQTGCTLSLQTMNAGSVTGIPIDPTTDLALGTLDVPYSTVDVYVRTATNAPVPAVNITLNNANTTGMITSFTSTVTLPGGLTGTATQGSVFGTTNTTDGIAHLKIIGTPTGQAKAGTTGGNGLPTITQPFTLTGTHTDVTLYTGSSGVLVPGTADDLADGDNVAPVVETQVPSRDPNGIPIPYATGDGNGDTIPDAQQPNVTSVPTFGMETGADYVTLVSPIATELTNVSTVDPVTLPLPPEKYQDLPEGLSKFIVTGVESGGDVIISIFTESTADVRGYAKYTEAKGWSTLTGDRVTLVNEHQVDIRLTDGGEGDADGAKNGQIDDPGGLLVIVDDQPPTVTITGVEDGKRYRVGSVPTAGCTATDNLALTGPCVGAFTNAEVGTSIGTHTYTATATDGEGTTGLSSATYTVFDDETPPTITLGGLAGGKTVDGELRFLLGAEPTPTCTAADEEGGSGLAGACAIERTSGSPSGVGLSTWTATATDNAGNQATQTVAYRVVYRFDGFAQPINDPRLTTAARSVFKAGSTVPVKFQLRRADGSLVTPTDAPEFVKSREGSTSASVNETASVATASSGATFTYADGWWHYNWKTDRSDAGTAFEIGAGLDDGTTQTVVIGLR